jgi:hypothetical protein
MEGDWVMRETYDKSKSRGRVEKLILGLPQPKTPTKTHFSTKFTKDTKTAKVKMVKRPESISYF